MAKSLTQKLGSRCGFRRTCLSQVLFAIFSRSPCVLVVSLFASLLGGVSYTVCVLFVGASTLFKRSRVGTRVRIWARLRVRARVLIRNK